MTAETRRNAVMRRSRRARPRRPGRAGFRREGASVSRPALTAPVRADARGAGAVRTYGETVSRGAAGPGAVSVRAGPPGRASAGTGAVTVVSRSSAIAMRSPPAAATASLINETQASTSNYVKQFIPPHEPLVPCQKAEHTCGRVTLTDIRTRRRHHAGGLTRLHRRSGPQSAGRTDFRVTPT